MAVVTTKSTIISNRDATPKVLTDAFVSAGDLRESEGYVSATATDSIGSVYKLCTVPSNARVTSLLLQNTAITSAAANVGVFWPTTIPVAPAGYVPSASQAGTVIDNNVWSASPVSLATATTTPAELVVPANVTIPQQEQALWQLAGLAADPGIDLDICLTLTAAATAAGTVGLKAKYVF